MNYTIEKDDESEFFVASTQDYPGTFYGYGKTKEQAVEDLKDEVRFALEGGYRLNIPEGDERADI